MKAKRIRVLGIALLTSMFIMMGCGERLGDNISSGGGTGNGEATSEATTDDNTTEESVTSTTEVEKENTGSEQQEIATNEDSTIYIVIQARNVYCDEQLLVDNSISIEDDSLKDTIGDFLKTAKENQRNVRLNIREADPEMEEIVMDSLKELGIEYEIEGE